ncbi:MAG: hypothetical protein UU37_C0005G0015 [Candidatus Gottesmanbacteria bacterium GW2011_GWA2_41_12]|uniref:Uncharacterized protein n=1 Tax=Candidatus Gottesmanbacteria bacterium GW2011_GWA2_41_12 TaxID=1618440 RepID=A0A0G0UHR1_9BACT|nr:MAG: hypothetical protein UU37_C0005G0015 [Candidatus Gottesmanbacteria bacterium GW2011_GWA2_41_12]
MTQPVMRPAEQASDRNIVTLNTQGRTRVRLESSQLAMLGDPMRSRVGRNVGSVPEFSNQILRNQPDLQTAGVSTDQMLDVLDHEVVLAVNTLRSLVLPISEEADITRRDTIRDWVVGLGTQRNPGLAPLLKNIGLPQIGRGEGSVVTETSIKEVTQRGSVVELENEEFSHLTEFQRRRVGTQAAGVLEFSDLMVALRPQLTELHLTDEQVMDVMDHSLTNAMNVVRGLTAPINDKSGIENRDALRDWVAGLAHKAEPGLAPISSSFGQPAVSL